MRSRQNSCQPTYSLRRVDCVGSLITQNRAHGLEVLLVWNADWRTPSWSLPGGARECQESLQEALVRETAEETGLDILPGDLIDVHEKIGLGGRLHLVIFTFVASIAGGELITDGGGEPELGGVTAARWFPLQAACAISGLERMLTSGFPAIVGAQYSWERRNERPRALAQTQYTKGGKRV